MRRQGTTSGKGQMMTLTLNTRQSTRTPRLRCSLAAEPVAAGVARRTVHRCFSGWPGPDAVKDDGLVTHRTRRRRR